MRPSTFAMSPMTSSSAWNAWLPRWDVVSAVAVRELEEASRRVDNPVLLRCLPDLVIDPTSIVANVEAERAEG